MQRPSFCRMESTKRKEKLPSAAEISCSSFSSERIRRAPKTRGEQAHIVRDSSTAGVHQKIEDLPLDRPHRDRIRAIVLVVPLDLLQRLLPRLRVRSLGGRLP